MALQEQTASTSKRVETKHARYKALENQWRRCRDCYDGNDAVKDKTVDRIYLPALDSHKSTSAGSAGAQAYEAYKTRAMFFNALSRTVDGLAGAVFQKPPVVEVPNKEAFQKTLDDATLRGEPAELVALVATREVLLQGRYGILVDVTKGVTPRAYWTAYRAADIVNWREERTDDDPAVLTMVVLREDDWQTEGEDEFVRVKRDSYRVLRLTNGVYTTQRWRQRPSVAPGVGRSLSSDTYEPGPITTPTRRGKPLDFIPFTFFGPTSIAVDPQKPPVLDLADVNLSHYRTSADLEHGRHYSGLPTPWLAGATSDAEVTLGPSGILFLEKGGTAGMLQSSTSFPSLELADKEKRAMMAVLGARLLEDQSGPAETATAVTMRHAGEHATLRTITGAVEQGFKEVLKTSVWWVEGTGEWEKVEASYALNKDFFNVKMSSEDAKTLLLMLQAQAISFEEFWEGVTEGNFIASDKTAKEVKAQIEREAPPVMGAPGAPGAPPAPAQGGAGLPPAPGVKPGAVRPGGAGAPPAPVGGLKTPPGTHLVRDAGQPGVPKGKS